MKREAYACAVVAVLGIAACGDASELAEPEGETLADTNPPTPFLIKSVVARGSGCRAGSWTATPTRAPTSILRPEQTGDPVVRLAFTGYGIELSAERPHATLDCNLTIELDGQEDIAFAPRQLQPVAFTDALRVSLGWKGNPAGAESFDLAETAAVSLRNARWSSCGGLLTLQVGTEIQADHRDWDRRIDLERLDITLLPRRCREASIDAGMAPSANADADAGVVRRTEDAAAPVDEGVVGARGLSLSAIRLSPRCPWSGKYELADEEDQITFLFDVFTLPNSQSFTPLSEQCWFKLEGSLPQGYEVAVGSFAAQGTASLLEGASLSMTGGAVARNSIGNALVVPPNARRSLVRGPHRGSFTIRQAFHGEELRWSGCGRSEIPFAISAEVLGSPLPEDGSVRLERLGPVAFVMRPCE